MTEFKIGNYTITSQSVYEVLKENDVSESILKKLDVNGDMTIAEDELQELAAELETEETSDDEDTEDSDSETTDSSVELSDETMAQIDTLNEQYKELKATLNALNSELGTASDMDTYDSIQSQIDSVQSNMNSNRMSVYNLLVAAENSALTSSGVSTSGTASATTGTGISGSSDFGDSIVSIAQSYVGKLNESDGSYLEVTGGRSEAWCADFVTYVVTKACEATGTDLNGFGSPSVSTLQAWGQANNCYGDITSMSSSERAAWIVENVTPGDVMIQKSNGASHTGIVTKVYSDGSFDTIEGNTSDQCLARHYSADSSKLSGFIDIA